MEPAIDRDYSQSLPMPPQRVPTSKALSQKVRVRSEREQDNYLTLATVPHESELPSLAQEPDSEPQAQKSHVNRSEDNEVVEGSCASAT
jgi:hypothetical protein